MAALAMVCKAIDQKPELQLDSPDAGPTERFLSSLQLNQTLQKPRVEDPSRYVYSPLGMQHIQERYLSANV